jgi:hypothetical protein
MTENNAAQAAAKILSYLGFAQAMSMELGVDRRRDHIQSLIESALLSKLRAPVADERAVVHAAPGRQYHILKTDPEVFQAALSGAKTFEIRLNDRGYAVGDVLGLRETKHTGAEMRAGAPLVYTGRECQRFVSHVLTGYGLADGWCCLSFELPHAGGESAPIAGEAQKPVAWAAVLSGGKRSGRVYATCDTREEIEAYIQDVHQSNDSLTLYARPLSFADAAPQASEAVGKVVLFGEDLKEVSWAGGKMPPPGTKLYAAPQAREAVCSCPTGDGSLRHPCAVHPPRPADKDGGDCSKGAAQRLHGLVEEVISWLETGGGRADSLCADLRRALAALASPTQPSKDGGGNE